jgi:hypothetical protein
MQFAEQNPYPVRMQLLDDKAIQQVSSSGGAFGETG